MCFAVSDSPMWLLFLVSCFYQPGTRSTPRWSYSYFAISVSVCLSVCLSVCHSLGRPGNEIMAAAVTYGCFELAGLFASPLQKETSTIDRHSSHYTSAMSRKQSQKRGNAKQPAANYEQAKVRNCARVAALCAL